MALSSAGKEMALLRCILRIIKFTRLRCTIQLFLINLQLVRLSPSVGFRTFSSFQYDPLCPCESRFYPLPLSPQTYLFWTFHGNRTVQSVVSCIWLLLLNMKSLRFRDVAICISSLPLSLFISIPLFWYTEPSLSICQFTDIGSS